MKKCSIFIFFIFGCTSLDANEVESKILSLSVLQEMGYKETKQNKYNGKQCDQYEVDFPAVKRYQSIKSLKAVETDSSIYYRFTLIAEKFENQEIAIKRLEQFIGSNKVKANSWYSKSCSLKKGFRKGNIVYFVATDAGMFTDQIPEILAQLSQLLERDS